MKHNLIIVWKNNNWSDCITF